MREPPPDVVASWPAPNYINPQTRGPALIVVELLTVFISTVCIALRLYVKARIIHSVGWDDWLIIGAAILGAGVTVCVVLASSRYGWDIHVWDLTHDKLVAGRQVSFAAQALFILSTWLAKTSILLNYLRFAPRGSWFRRLSIAGIGLTALITVSFFVTLFSQCRPITSYWNPALYSHHCIHEGPSVVAHAAITAILDFYLWVLPLPTLYHTKLPLSQRIALITLFSFALVVILAGGIRTYWTHYVVDETYDVTWYGFHLWLWTAVEVQLGLICGCVPWLKSLFKFWKTGRTVAGSSDQIRSDAQQTTGFKQATVVRMESLGKAWTGEKSGKEEYLDLERGSASGDSLAQLRFS